MTIPGGPPAPAPHPPHPAAHQPGYASAAPGPWPPPGALAWPGPPPEARDRTARTLGILGIVAGGLALSVQLAMLVVPFVFMGLLFGLDEGLVEDGLGYPPSAERVTGRVDPASDGSVRGRDLADRVGDAVARDVPWTGDVRRLECEDVARVTPDVSVLCTAGGQDRWYAVVRFTATSGAFDAYTLYDLQGENW
ncbi:hypothetical protein ACK8HX_06700 [Oryzobacter sp. R7]|uniref:hypothetical protein n=1 Tax=Oryzobacter faecalis TaxID=3388656 RepID=UPI00398D3EA8